MIFFLRHNKLVSPFDNYDLLKFDDLINLSNQKLSPNISKKFENNKILDLIKKNKIDLVYTSKIKRTQETAKLLWFENFFYINELKEIFFNINFLINENEYKKYGLKIVRERLWKNLYLNNNSVENINSISLRLEKFINLLRNDYNKNILVISHWFLLILLKLKINNIDFEKLSYEEFIKQDLAPINYLNWFFLDKIKK